MPASVSSQVAALTAIVERMDQRAEEDRSDRKEAQREAEIARLGVSAELVDMRHSQINVVKRLDKIEPVTDLVTSWRGKLAGIMIVMGFIGALATFIILFFKDAIMGLFQ